MWRFVFHCCDPTPALEGELWIPILRPRTVPHEVDEHDPRRIWIGGTVVTLSVSKCPDCKYPGPAFELTAGDDLAQDVAVQLFDEVYKNMYRASSRQYPVLGAICSAHGRTIQSPAGTYPPSEVGRA